MSGSLISTEICRDSSGLGKIPTNPHKSPTDFMTIVTRSILDKELSKLEANIVRLGSMVELSIEQAMRALEGRTLPLARQVIANDSEINQLRYEVEEDCLRVLATQHPKASDLRAVVAAIHIAIELERMGDHAVGIATLVERMEEEDDISSLHQLPKMAKRARKMIRLAIDAYVSHDPELAEALIPRDQKINQGYDKLFANAMEEMRNDEYIRLATFLLWIGHNLERIGDRCVNIAERVVFMATAQFPDTQ